MRTRSFLAAIDRVWDRVGDGLLAAGLFAASLAIYVQTLAPSVVTLFDDSLEFPLVAHRLAIAHPTGYPLYTLLGKLFSLGPFPNVAWAVNLLSAVAAAVTVALVYLVTRQLTRRQWPAALGAVALAVSPVFWSQAVVAEVYGLNAAFVALLLWLVLRWSRRPLVPVTPFSLLQVAPKAKPERLLPGVGFWARVPLAVRQVFYRVYSAYRRLFPAVPPKQRLELPFLIFLLTGVYGLSLTHHRTMLLLAPALLVFVVLVERRALSRAALLGPEHPERPGWLQRAGRPVVLLSLCFLLPLLLYLYLPIRGGVGSLDGAYTNTWSGFWGWVLASDYSAFLGDNPLARDLDAAFYAGLFWRQFGPVGLALALVGLIGLLRQPKALALTSLALLTYIAFAILYRVPDVEVFFIPGFLLVAIWFGTGIDYATDLLQPRGGSMAVRRLLAVCGTLLLLLAIAQPLIIAVRAYPDVDLSQRWSAHDYGSYLLGQPLPPDSTVVGLLGEMTLLRYFQQTAGLRPDVLTVAADQETDRRAAIKAALASGNATYITRPLLGLDVDYALRSVIGMIDVAGDLETLIRVGEPPYEVSGAPHAVDIELLPGLGLLGYGLHEHRDHWQAWARLRLWWQAPEGLVEPFKVSARLLDAGGQVVAATDAEPVSGAYAAPAWRPGEVVADAYEIPLPAGLPPGEYTPLVIVYEPGTGAELGRVELVPAYLEGNLARPPRRALEQSEDETLCAIFGEVELLGFTPPNPETAFQPGGTLPLTLLWQARTSPSGDWQLALWLEGDSEYLLALGPVGGRYPSDLWQPGQVVRQWLAPQLLEGIPPGSYQLRMRVLHDARPVPWGCWQIPLGSDLDLGPVDILR